MGEPAKPANEKPSLRLRSNTVPARLDLPPVATNGDFELRHWKSGYTSLKDILPKSPVIRLHSPATTPGGEISIRNRLLQQAAWAYLQPMASSTEPSDRRHSLRQFWSKLSCGLTDSFPVVIQRLIDRIRIGRER